MRKVTGAKMARVETGTPPAPTSPLRRVRRIGYVVLALQLAGFLVWSTLVYRRFALSLDFAQFNQAWFLITHGNLDPFDSVRGYPWWRDHCAFVLWPLALLYWPWPHGVTMLWLQDICVVGAEAVAFTWLCEIAHRYRPGRDAAWLAGAGLVLLAANPWMWWAVTFDFHIESPAIPFAVLLLRDLANGRRRAWLWVVPLLSCGDVAATYLAGVGLGGVLASRRTRFSGALMACVGVGVTLLISLVHGNLGSGGSRGGLEAYYYLVGPAAAQPSVAALVKGIALHPLGALRAVWAKRLDVWANLAPSGLVAVGSLWLLPTAAIVLLANDLPAAKTYAYPSFQTVPLYVLLPVGTVAVLGWLARRRRRMILLLTGLVVAQALAWAAVWVPQTPGRWLRVSGATAATLAGIEARIPASAEVIASQGVMGRFAGRAAVHGLFGPASIQLNGGETWFVIVPLAGIESQTTASAMALVGELTGPLHATLVTHAHGVWAFRWRPPPDMHTIAVPTESAPLPAWTAVGAAGQAVMFGPVANWHVTSTGGQGYVADGLAWQEPPGRYQALVKLFATGPANVEVWNDTGDTLLARRSIPATAGIETVAVPVDAATAYTTGPYSGWGPFRADFLPPLRGNRLEVRVWSRGTGTVNVYSAFLVGASRSVSSRQSRLRSEGADRVWGDMGAFRQFRRSHAASGHLAAGAAGFDPGKTGPG